MYNYTIQFDNVAQPYKTNVPLHVGDEVQIYLYDTGDPISYKISRIIHSVDNTKRNLKIPSIVILE